MKRGSSLIRRGADRARALLVALGIALGLLAAPLAAHAATPGGIAAIAQAQVGKPGSDFWPQPEDWCADFAGWVWRQAGVVGAGEIHSAVSDFQDYGTRHGTGSSTPHVGDAVVHKAPGHSHVQIVVGVSADRSQIQTVGGNEYGSIWDSRGVHFQDWHDTWADGTTEFVSPVGVSQSVGVPVTSGVPTLSL
ncbi:CHAP domain-containing protein, partial [Solihabitans fulvus]